MKLKIALRILGHKAPDLDVGRLERWQSELWELHEHLIDTLPLNGDADLPNWGYSDEALSERVVPKQGADLTIFMLNVPLEDNYYFRRVSRNVACVTLFEVAEMLRSHNIPIENLVLRMIYSCVLIHARKGHLPPISEIASFAHHETKGCIFDMTGIKTDIVFSCHRPIFCASCRVSASENSVSKEFLDRYEAEISKIKKRLFYLGADWVKQQPVLALILSSVLALLLGIAGSLIASVLYEKFNEQNKAMAPAKDASTQIQREP